MFPFLSARRAQRHFPPVKHRHTLRPVRAIFPARILRHTSMKGFETMPGLVLEGGTFRPVFSCGAMDALLDNDIEIGRASCRERV